MSRVYRAALKSMFVLDRDFVISASSRDEVEEKLEELHEAYVASVPESIKDQFDFNKCEFGEVTLVSGDPEPPPPDEVAEITARSKADGAGWYFEQTEEAEDEFGAIGEVCFKPSESARAMLAGWGGRNIKGVICEEMSQKNWEKVEAAFKDRERLLQLLTEALGRLRAEGYDF